MYIITIDVGIKNLGFTIFDCERRALVAWDVASLVQHENYVPSKNVQYVKRFVDKYREYFERAIKVVIERQIRTNMRIIEAVFETLFFEKVLIITAKSVKMHFGTSTKNYRGNKKKAVEFVQQGIEQRAPWVNYMQDCMGAWQKRSKQDDLADALMLLLYYIDTYLF